jgi:hypothetical protein
MNLAPGIGLHQPLDGRSGKFNRSGRRTTACKQIFRKGRTTLRAHNNHIGSIGRSVACAAVVAAISRPLGIRDIIEKLSLKFPVAVS